MGLTSLLTIYDRERSVRRIAGHFWYTATRQGLIGVRQWLVEASYQEPPPAEPVEPEDLPGAEADAEREKYADWLLRYDPVNPAGIAAARHHLATLQLPELLILAVVRPDTLPLLHRMVRSWRSSIHPGWRALLLPASALSAEEQAQLRAMDLGPGVGIAANADAVGAARAAAAHTLLCFGATLLNPLSAYMFLHAAGRSGAEIVYCDHDRVDADEQRSDPAFKPQFSPEFLARYNYVGNCLLLARSVPLGAEDLHTLQDGGAEGFDRLVGRLAAHRKVEHLPFTLFHVADAPRHATHDLPTLGRGGTTAAIIIPTRDGLEHLSRCIDSIFAQTDYDLDLVELIVVDNNSVEPETLAYLDAFAARPRCTVLRYPGAFNFADINNVGARAATGEILVFINNDTSVHDPAWLAKLVAHAAAPGVGMVGCKLLYPDGTIQHGGCVAGSSRGTVEHLLSNVAADEVADSDHTREMTTMTGACLAVRRTVFHGVGGFDPILRITWNDVKTCLSCLQAGFRNIYVADPLLIHYESKTRQKDNTREGYIRYFSEGHYARKGFGQYFFDDPSYNPNLSLLQAGLLAEPPRTQRPWFRTGARPPCILILSSVYRIGFGVPLVIHQHAIKLKQLGFDVVIGGPEAENEFSFAGCERVVLDSPKAAADYAFDHDISLIISHTPPFFELPILVGGHTPVLAYDYGEPDAEFFPEPVRSYLANVEYQKREAAALTTRIATISQAVKDATLNKDALVVGLANSHLPAWSEAFRPDRDRFRAEQGWEDCFVVLTVCRFHENERSYKGLDKIADMIREFPFLYPDQSRPMLWVLAGRGTEEDVKEVERLGFTVFPNVSDATLAELYKAADAYVGFSRWEGYNLGVSQALAMGLPTLASDIPAHREFPISTTNSVLVACGWLAGEVARNTAGTAERRATVFEWERSTAAFARLVEDLLAQSPKAQPRLGASGCDWEDLAA